jgi:hypothetical protein
MCAFVKDDVILRIQHMHVCCIVSLHSNSTVTAWHNTSLVVPSRCTERVPGGKNNDGRTVLLLTAPLNTDTVLGMDPSREIRRSLKDRLLTRLFLFSGAATIVALSFGFFGFVLPSMSGARRLSPGEAGDWAARRQQGYDLFWSDKKPFIFNAIGWLTILLLVALGLWCLYRVFTYVCARLDDEGHWNSVIAKRYANHHHRS